MLIVKRHILHEIKQELRAAGEKYNYKTFYILLCRKLELHTFIHRVAPLQSSPGQQITTSHYSLLQTLLPRLVITVNYSAILTPENKK